MASPSKKKTRISHKRMVTNIRDVFNSAAPQERLEGMNWYLKAHVEANAMATKYRIPTAQAVGVVAALSPGNVWERNLEHARLLINDFKAGLRGADLPLVGSYGRNNVTKSERILLGEDPRDVLGGLKVRAFYECLLNPWNPADSAVCIDRHAKSIAMGYRVLDKDASVSPKQYALISAAYRAAANELQLAPHQIQAITWVAWRNRILRGEV